LRIDEIQTFRHAEFGGDGTYAGLSGPARSSARRGTWLLTAVIALATVWLALDPSESLPFTPPFGAWNDKFLHACAFALLAAIVAAKGPAPRALALLVILAVAIEFAQFAVPQRDANLDDLLASVVGIALGWAGAKAAREVTSLALRWFR